MKNEKYHTVKIFPKFNRKIVKRSIIDTIKKQLHNHSLPWLATDTSIKSGRV
jgi:hypothetical protein